VVAGHLGDEVRPNVQADLALRNLHGVQSCAGRWSAGSLREALCKPVAGGLEGRRDASLPSSTLAENPLAARSSAHRACVCPARAVQRRVSVERDLQRPAGCVVHPVEADDADRQFAHRQPTGAGTARPTRWQNQRLQRPTNMNARQRFPIDKYLRRL
jgi:hypothetical protein